MTVSARVHTQRRCGRLCVQVRSCWILAPEQGSWLFSPADSGPVKCTPSNSTISSSWPDKRLPLGHVRYIKPTTAFPEIRLRFTPAHGNVYGSSKQAPQGKPSDPNIVDVHSVNVDGTRLYVLMENLEGKSLNALLDEEFGRGMPLSRAWPIIEAMRPSGGPAALFASSVFGRPSR